MFRRILACLVLITGLAAAGAPAHAGFTEALNARLEMTQKRDETQKSDEQLCAERQRQQRLKGERAKPCQPSAPITIIIPTVQFGADRAFE
ncbi:hypothetical protein [Qipengyuania marisflavi]|uniref:Uncharacterized protein n=1 Tax=Qipengyuania marisflavi TaxID=2486356 RepID=A0A5S3Q075_9SPHN|nr:hypothetical protein [Qipengyuania marisflavi]TMM49727.1 hypothetical protein FEV51_00525 [Qipengyuania marisflavi]